jgi:hypothetical protein
MAASIQSGNGLQQTISGSRLAVNVNAQPVAFSSSFTVNQENTLLDVNVLDQLEVAELANVGIKVNCTLNIFKVDQALLQELGVDYTTDPSELFALPSVNFDIIDQNGNTQYSIMGIKFEGGSGSADARGVWTGTWNFRGTKRTADGTL